MPLERLREEFADAGQMLALDPPGDDATIGGIVATGDSGPLRHRYGGPRDLVLGVTVALPDGTVAQAGGKVIKNVAGYDLSKLMTGSFGTLGLIAQVALRLHPLPRETVTAYRRDATTRASWRGSRTRRRTRSSSRSRSTTTGAATRGSSTCASAASRPRRRPQAAAKLLAEAGAQTNLVHDDAELWQRAGRQAALARTGPSCACRTRRRSSPTCSACAASRARPRSAGSRSACRT